MKLMHLKTHLNFHAIKENLGEIAIFYHIIRPLLAIKCEHNFESF